MLSKSCQLLSLYITHDLILLQGAVLGPGEFFHGLALGGQQFFAGTIGTWQNTIIVIIHNYTSDQTYFAIGGVSGALGRITGALAKTTTKLTLDEEFQEERKRAGAKGIGQGLEGAAKVDFITLTISKNS